MDFLRLVFVQNCKRKEQTQLISTKKDRSNRKFSSGILFLNLSKYYFMKSYVVFIYQICVIIKRLRQICHFMLRILTECGNYYCQNQYFMLNKLGKSPDLKKKKREKKVGKEILHTRTVVSLSPTFCLPFFPLNMSSFGLTF